MTLDPSSDKMFPFRSFAMVSMRESNCPMADEKPISSSSSLPIVTAGPNFVTVGFDDYTTGCLEI